MDGRDTVVRGEDEEGGWLALSPVGAYRPGARRGRGGRGTLVSPRLGPRQLSPPPQLSPPRPARARDGWSIISSPAGQAWRQGRGLLAPLEGRRFVNALPPFSRSLRLEKCAEGWPEVAGRAMLGTADKRCSTSALTKKQKSARKYPRHWRFISKKINYKISY